MRSCHVHYSFPTRAGPNPTQPNPRSIVFFLSASAICFVNQRIHDAMHALKKIGQSRADAKAADRYEELYSELQQRTDDYDAAIEAAAGRHCPSGEIWENISVGKVTDYTCKLFMAREKKMPTVYWYRGVFRIKGSLGRCLVGGDEMELWPEWLM